MPQARKSTRSSLRKSAAFKEPAALKQLNRSLEAAQKALVDLRKHAGRDAGKTTQSLHADVRQFVASAKRDSGKLNTALKRDFEQTRKTLASASAPVRGGKTSSKRTARRTTAKRGTRKTS
jgi:hypothetical protein